MNVIKAAATIIWLLHSSNLQMYVTANYDIHVLFYEFHNPSNLSCANYYCRGDGGAANCCDDLTVYRNCFSQCRPQFRLSLKEFGTTVNHLSRHGSNVFYTGRFNTSSIVFSQGEYGLINASNPFVVTEENEWTGRIQLFIDAIDHDVRQLGQGDTIIAYGINLELQLGEGFTQRATYVSQVWIQVRSINIDLSFKVRCSENYYGPSCGKVCRPVEGVSTCDQDGNVTSLNEIISIENISTQTTNTADNNCTLMPCTNETGSKDENQEPTEYITLVAVFASLFVLSLTFAIVMVIIVIWKLRTRNGKSGELSQKKPSTLAHNTTTDEKHNDIGVVPNEAYGSLSANFVMDSNELYQLGQQNTHMDSTESDTYEAI